jgi:hypothetical protein
MDDAGRVTPQAVTTIEPGVWEVTLERPGRVEGTPPVDVRKRTRRITFGEHGEHWVEVRGGGTNRERIWHQAMLARLTTIEDPIAREIEAIAQLATFLDDRVVAHNITDWAGNELPQRGLDLAWELSFTDLARLVGQILYPPALFADPKAATSSSNGTSMAG